MQALMLAAGMGRRLGKYTDNQTKCMVKVGGKTLLEHTVEALKNAGIDRLVLVVGYEAERLCEFCNETIKDMEVIFVHNDDYAVTNNIYSLYLAREELTKDDTILVESDLIYEKNLLQDVANYPFDNVVAVAPYRAWMDGTVTLLTKDGFIDEFVEKKDFSFDKADLYHKTVNVYKFSKEFSAHQYIPFLEAYLVSHGKNQYYEVVLKTLAKMPDTNLKAFVLGDQKWYEIDDVQDLDIAETLFAPEGKSLENYARHFGGYWRYDNLRDFCYLVNPYFPPKKMLDQMKYSFDQLLRDYPSGMRIQKLIAGKMFGMDGKYLLCGNGAAELIGVLGQELTGKAAVAVPAFNEYIRCFKGCDITKIPLAENDFWPDKQRLLELAETMDTIFLINPDNPSGGFLRKEDILELLACCKRQGTTLVVDESFVDFAEKERRFTLLNDEILAAYPNLIVVKSISKSYGVPGLRLGVLATSDEGLLARLKERLPVWNINSFAEYFLQIYGLYAGAYESACDKIVERRKELAADLQKLSFLSVYPSEANYLMVKVQTPHTSRGIAEQLLLKKNILIKDLSGKNGFDGGQYIRVAVKDEDDNAALLAALHELGQ